MPEIYGYVLAGDEDADVKLKSLGKLEIDQNHIFRDKASSKGKPPKRKMFGALLEMLDEGDMIYMTSLSDFGNDYDSAMRDWNYIVKEVGADIAILDMPLIDTRWRKDVVGTYVSDVVTSFFDYMGRDKKRRKKLQSRGIEEALKDGRKFGRPSGKLPEDFDEIAERCIEGELRQADAADMLGMSRSTFRYHMLKVKNGQKGR